MAIRNKQLHPDQMYPTVAYGPIPIISQEALTEAMIEAASWVDFAGGTFTLVTERHPTDAPNEMVTIRAMIQWKDRTDARPQPEEQAELSPAPVAEYDVDDELEADDEPTAVLPFEHETALTPEELEQHFPSAPAPAGELGDGIVEEELPEEDDSEIPAEAR